MQQTALNPPKRYHAYQNILQCYDTVIASYISGSGLPYHWLFSEHWGFYYYDAERFYYRRHYSRYPLWDALRKLYKVRKTMFTDIPLTALLDSPRFAQKKQMFVIADEFDLPWTPEYQNIHHPHYFLLTDYDKAGHKVYVNDWWPVPYQDWLDLSMLEASFQEMGEHAFVLSEPSFHYSDALLLEQMEVAYTQMTGWEDNGLSAGIYGIRRFQQDILRMGQETASFIDRWFYMVKLTIEAKYLFLEYVLFLKVERGCPIPDAFTQLLERTINGWFSFRNTMMSAKIRKSLQPDKLADRLGKVVELEQACAEQWGDIMQQTRLSVQESADHSESGESIR